VPLEILISCSGIIDASMAVLTSSLLLHSAAEDEGRGSGHGAPWLATTAVAASGTCDEDSPRN
jgi:hypothetical protein